MVLVAALVVPAADASQGVRVSQTAADGGTAPCSPIRVGNEPPFSAAGGCLARVRSRPVEIKIETMVGEAVFATCRISFDMRIDGSGRTLVSDFNLFGFSPCNDVVVCFQDRTITPWRGQIVAGADGALRYRTDACLDTCMGRFAGEVVVPLEPRANGWRAEVTSAPLGSSGWVLGGPWRIDAPGVKVDPNGG
jgi:hypothetical protein